MYPFMSLNEDTEIIHSDMGEDGRVKVYMETPDEKYGFRYATCWLPEMKWENVYKYSDEQLDYLKKLVEAQKSLIVELALHGGIYNADNI